MEIENNDDIVLIDNLVVEKINEDDIKKIWEKIFEKINLNIDYKDNLYRKSLLIKKEYLNINKLRLKNKFINYDKGENDENIRNWEEDDEPYYFGKEVSSKNTIKIIKILKKDPIKNKKREKWLLAKKKLQIMSFLKNKIPSEKLEFENKELEKIPSVQKKQLRQKSILVQNMIENKMKSQKIEATKKKEIIKKNDFSYKQKELMKKNPNKFLFDLKGKPILKKSVKRRNFKSLDIMKVSIRSKKKNKFVNNFYEKIQIEEIKMLKSQKSLKSIKNLKNDKKEKKDEKKFFYRKLPNLEDIIHLEKGVILKIGDSEKKNENLKKTKNDKKVKRNFKRKSIKLNYYNSSKKSLISDSNSNSKIISQKNLFYKKKITESVLSCLNKKKSNSIKKLNMKKFCNFLEEKSQSESYNKIIKESKLKNNFLKKKNSQKNFLLKKKKGILDRIIPYINIEFKQKRFSVPKFSTFKQKQIYKFNENFIKENFPN